MPNWTYNKIKCKKELGDKILDKKDGDYVLDFNKLIPMPESLKIPAGSIEDKAIASYYFSLDKEGKRDMEDKLSNAKLSFGGDYWRKYESDILQYKVNPEKLIEEEKSFDGTVYDCEEKFASLSELGKRYFDNIVNYGHAQWYNWCTEIWGTKWNVESDIEVDYNVEDEEYTIEFNTAWSLPYGIVEKYSQLCTDDEFNWEYEDEDSDGYHILSKNSGKILDHIVAEDEIENEMSEM
ncbi:MAG: hypothetical protein Q4G05_01595 [Clostridia bacterium]|nr:hypothetical protein [Clostridia bacterium]